VHNEYSTQGFTMTSFPYLCMPNMLWCTQEQSHTYTEPSKLGSPPLWALPWYSFLRQPLHPPPPPPPPPRPNPLGLLTVPRVAAAGAERYPARRKGSGSIWRTTPRLLR
jgi:hypothetical protein